MGIFTQTLTVKITILCMLLVIEAGPRVMMVTGEVYNVGDSAGWTANSNSNYASWSSSKTFHVHDVLLFKYNATNDNVIQVTLSEFRSCNTSAPMRVYNSGNDSFTIKARGHYFFTSNFSGHCQSGQKLDVRVITPSQATVKPPSSPITGPSPSPSHKAAAPVESKVPAPSPADSNAARTHEPKWLLMSILGVTISGLVLLAGYV